MKKMILFSCTFKKKAVILHSVNLNGYYIQLKSYEYHAKTKFVFCATF